MTNEKDKVLAHNAIDSVASSYRKSDKDGELFVEARFNKLCTSFESVIATVRKEERGAAFKDAAVIASDFRRLDQDTLWARYKTLTLETALLEATENRKGE